MPFGLGAGLGVRPMLKRTLSMTCSSDDPRSPKRPDFDTNKYFRSDLPQEVSYPALAALPPLASFQPIHPAPTLQPLPPLQQPEALQPIPELSLSLDWVPEEKKDDPEIKAALDKVFKPVQPPVKTAPIQRRRRAPPIPSDRYEYFYGGHDTPFIIPKHTVIVPESLVLSMLRRLGSDPDRRW